MICNMILLLLGFLGIVYILKGYSETFVSPGSYPASVDRLLLEYPFGNRIKKNKLNDDGVKQVYTLYPKTQMKSYAQITNNQKNKVQICDGKAIPISFCNSFYGASKIPDKQQKLHRPCEGRRVNFYNY